MRGVTGMGILVLSEALRSKLGEEAVKGLVEALNTVAATTRERTVEVVSERFERGVGGAKSELARQIAEVKADLIKWMFVFWLGQAATVVAIVQSLR